MAASIRTEGASAARSESVFGALVALVLAAIATGQVRDPEAARSGSADALSEVRGMTISCQTWGREWGTDAFATELDELLAVGVNWVAIHPYASVRSDGSLRWRELDPENPPQWLTRPIREAHARGMGILLKPHLAYWGSPFSWRGTIDFADGPDRERFWSDYRRWIAQLAVVCSDADAFVVGTELALLERDEDQWRAVVDDVRARTDAHLTYAANWDRFESVTFWDALDCIGVQGYFPLSDGLHEGELPESALLERAWTPHLAALEALHRRTGKPVVLTEVGFTQSLSAAATPWASRTDDDPRAVELQDRCLRATLAALGEAGPWLRGGFLWKCFPGPSRSRDFALESDALRAAIAERWLPETPSDG